MQGNSPDEEHTDPHGECAAEIKRLRDALSDLEQMATAVGPHITGQAGMLAARLGKSIERARAALTN